MAAQFCQCGNPQACICYQTPRRPDFHLYNPFPPHHRLHGPASTFPRGHSTSRTPLGNVTNAANVVPAATQRPKRKRRSQNQDAEPSRSRRRTDSSPAPNAPSVYGVGPSAAAADAGERASESVFHPSLVNIPGVDFGSLLDKRTSSSASATDVWKEFSHVACRFCPLDKWRTWKNVDGQTSVIRDHLKADHYRVWVDVVFHKKLKGWNTIGASRKAAAGEHEEFSLPGFYDRLANGSLLMIR
ncbi:hypothetical protein B0H10DRAFT_1971341 [Mycena sp. CBHHK59/15]|nr:hypothetical protein B0H10DRAFT_1971341 [Mycena sp. CBHHK59/15]